MKIIVTGSLGHIGRPLTEILTKQGHKVTVITSNPERQKDIEALGARAAVGTLEDAAFLAETLAGADAAYCMVPPNHFQMTDPIGHFQRTAENYAEAIRKTGVKRIVLLSSYGADLDKGTGLIVGAHLGEQILSAVPDISLTVLRPTYFYYNLLLFTKMIQSTGTIAANYGADKIVMVAPADIAAAVAEEIVKKSSERVRYVASDDPTGNDVARILGQAIGKPDLKWVIISDEEMKRFYQSAGLPGHIAEGIVEMFASLREGRMDADYRRHEPAVKGEIKLTDFARDFAAAYSQN